MGNLLNACTHHKYYLIVLVWVLLYAWRPYYFGFYHDDWNLIGEPIDWARPLGLQIINDPTRPLGIIINFILRHIFGSTPFWWQVSLSLTQMAIAFQIYFITKKILLTIDDIHPKFLNNCDSAALIASCCFLVFPWSLGYSAWACLLGPNIGMILALFGVILALHFSKSNQIAGIFYAIFLFSLSWSIYEATWFIWLPFGFLMLSLTRKIILKTNYWIKFLFISTVFQTIFIVLNRFITSYFSKKRGADIDVTSLMHTYKVDGYLFIKQVLIPLGWLNVLIALGLLGLFLMSSNVITKKIITGKSYIYCGVSLLSGIFASVTLYGLAGYSVEWEGLFGRTTFLISIIIAIGFGILSGFAMFASSFSSHGFTLVMLLTSLIFFPLGVRLFEESKKWHASWTEQMTILNSIPAGVLDLANRDTIILMDINRGTAPVYTFSAFWDITGAIIPRLRLENITPSLTYHPYAMIKRPHEWRTVWDGKRVTQSWCNPSSTILWSFPVEKLFLWSEESPDFVQKLNIPYDSGC